MKVYDIKTEIEKSGLSLNRVADLSDYARTNLVHLLQGKREYKYNTYEKIINALGHDDIMTNDEVMGLMNEILTNTCYTVREWSDMTGIDYTTLLNIRYKEPQSINFKYIKNVAKMFHIYNDLDLKYCITLDEMMERFFESARNVSPDLDEIARYTGIPLRTLVENVATHWASGEYKTPKGKTAEKMRRFL